MDRAGATISDAPMVDGAGRSPCAGLTFTENAIIDPGNTIILNGRIAILICSLYEQCHSFVVRKKGSYRKNKPFCLLAVAALFFVQSYLNDIAHRGSITTHLYKERPAANGCRPENFIFFHCPLDGVRFSETFRYCCIVGCQNDKRRVETSGGATGVGGTNPGMPQQRSLRKRMVPAARCYNNTPGKFLRHPSFFCGSSNPAK